MMPLGQKDRYVMISFPKFYWTEFNTPGAIRMIPLMIVLVSIMRLFVWSTIDTMPDNKGTLYEMFLMIVFGIVIVICVAGLLLMTVQPICAYIHYRCEMHIVSTQLHWSGGLNKAISDFTKALIDGKTASGEIRILLKEARVHLYMKDATKLIQSKIEGALINTQFVVTLDHETQYNQGLLVLKVDGKIYTRSDTQLD